MEWRGLFRNLQLWDSCSLQEEGSRGPRQPGRKEPGRLPLHPRLLFPLHLLMVSPTGQTKLDAREQRDQVDAVHYSQPPRVGSGVDVEGQTDTVWHPWGTSVFQSQLPSHFFRAVFPDLLARSWPL